YPHATLTAAGAILLVSGQGTERRRRFLIDPDWLLEKHVEADMRSLDEWHVFKGIGPAAGFWRDRTQGPLLVPHPDNPRGSHLVLHVRKPDERDPDGACWNFPAARSGTMKIRLRFEPEFGGAQISLTDRFFDPCDDAGEANATYSVPIDSQYLVAEEVKLSPATWHDLHLQWNDEACRVSVDGQLITTLKAKEVPTHGLSYVRFRSRASDVDPQGFYVESIVVDIAND
ncbi:MAG: hypothetical protein RJP95_00260, partial [Pirellulales bacterium]